MTDETTISTYLRGFMEAQWLRPETAVWRTLDCLALHGLDFVRPILDLGCGDGSFSFTRAGGRMELTHDAFSHVGELEAFFDKVDIFNHYDDSCAPPTVVRKPDYVIDTGLDHKEALLKKAMATGLYHSVVQADASKALPLEDGRYKTIYSNIVYWIDNYPDLLCELSRVLADDGSIILQLPSETYRDYSFYQRLHVKTGDPDWAWLDLLDRGRSNDVKHCRTRQEWETDFAKAGLRTVHHRRYLSRLVLEAWDIGLRPISPMLIEMANKLGPEDRKAIKAKWIDNLMPLLRPLCRLETPQDLANPPGFHLFVLKKA